MSYEFELSGGELCLDFANTVSDRPTRAIEHLVRYQDLLSWGLQAGVLNDEQVRRLAAAAAERPDAARETLEQALRLREAIYRIFSAVARDDSPAEADLEVLTEAAAGALARSKLARVAAKFAWAWQDGGEALDRVLWPVARSAAELLTSDTLEKVTECSARDCGWLFLDTSKNHSRRWCDMAVCGNREKVRRLRERRGAGSARAVQPGA